MDNDILYIICVYNVYVLHIHCIHIKVKLLWSYIQVKIMKIYFIDYEILLVLENN